MSLWGQPVLKRQTWLETGLCRASVFPACSHRYPLQELDHLLPEGNFERSKAQILLENREIHRRARDRCALPPSCPLFVKYNFQPLKGYLGVPVFKYLVPLLNGLHPPPHIQHCFPKGRREIQKREKMEWVGDWKTTFYLNVETCHASYSLVFFLNILPVTLFLYNGNLELSKMVICFKSCRKCMPPPGVSFQKREKNPNPM